MPRWSCVRSFADVLGSPASRIYACFARLSGAEADEQLIREMVRLAFRFDTDRVKRYIDDMEVRLGGEKPVVKQDICRVMPV
jgi:hypothetical protein